MSGHQNKPKGNDDIPENDVRFIVWQLNNLIETTRTGFEDIKRLYAGLDQRVTALELWRAAIDAADKIQANQPKEQTKDSSSTDNLIKIIFIILGLLGTALGLVGSGIIKGG